jgi:ribonucleoside-diphosphate reductase alpha chain
MTQNIVETVEVDNEKLKLLNKNELDDVDKFFSTNALRVLAARYLMKNDKGEIIESPKELFIRVATHVTIPDVLYDKEVFSKEKGEKVQVINIANLEGLYKNYEEHLGIGKYKFNIYHFEAFVRLFNYLAEEGHMKVTFTTLIRMLLDNTFFKYEDNVIRYYNLMASKDFMPNTPCLANSGTRLGQLSACFVLPIEDNLNSIMESARDAALIFQSGGGVGINYSNLRAEGSPVSSTHGVASGPVSFMSIVDAVTNVVKQGGKRRGANMGILNWNHKDVERFITEKKKPGVLENFNVSVATDEEFWNDFKTGEGRAEYLMNLIAQSAHASAEPGMIFFDNINRTNILMKARGKPLDATNPCSEQSLYPYESCNLGSINLSNFVENGKFNWERFVAVVKITTHFLDNVIDVNKYPLKALYDASFETRRIGLGIMGLADAMLKLKIPYNSDRAFALMDKIGEALTFNSMWTSIVLAGERGVFGLYNFSGYKEGNIPVIAAEGQEWEELKYAIQKHGIRNSYCTTIAPTGSISMIADCSSGLEPIYSLVYTKKVAIGVFNYANPFLEEALKSEGLFNEQVLQAIAKNGGVNGLPQLPQWIKEVFKSAHDLSWEDHVKVQALWQRWINNGISKTINMPKEASVEDVRKAYQLAHDSGCFGLSIYRDGSRMEQVYYSK